MRWLSIAILVMVVLAFSPVKSAQADGFSFSIGFHDELSPYGTWVNYSNYGNVWRPYGYSGFRPYVDGYWGYTNYGPTWYGNEPYAPYVYHYGNWIFTPMYGWVWIPGYQWHPGQVNWSYGGGYIGWRPAYPAGYNYYGNDANLWVVIDADRWGYDSYRPYALRTAAVRDLWDRRVFRERYDTIRRADLERVVRRPVRTLELRENTVRIGDRKVRMMATRDDEVKIRKNVAQVRERANKGKDRVEKDTVMKRKFDDIRTKSEVRGNGIAKSNLDRSKSFKKAEDVRSSKSAGKPDVARSSKSDRKPDVVRSSKSDRKPDVVRSSKSSKSDVVRSSKSDRKSDNVRSSQFDRKPDSRSSKQKVEKVEKSKRVSTPKGREIDKRSGSSSRSFSTRKSDDRSSKGKVVSSRGSDRDRVSKARVSDRKPSKVERASYSVRKNEVRSSKGKAEVSKARTTKREPAKKQKTRDRRS